MAEMDGNGSVAAPSHPLNRFLLRLGLLEHHWVAVHE